MNAPVFQKADFTLCDVPVPKGYPQSQTHAGVAFFENKYYLTTSPFPGPQYGVWEARFRKLVRTLSFGKFCPVYCGEKYENPCIYFGCEQEDRIPVHFRLMQQSALMETPEPFLGFPSYNSDPDIFIEKGIIHVLNRCVIRTKVYNDHRPYDFKTQIYLLKGVDEHGHFKLMSNQLVRESDDNYVSPSLIKFKDLYLVAFLDNRLVRGKVVFNNLFLSPAETIEDAIRAENKHSVKVNGCEMIPWHMSLFQFHGDLYTVVTCVRKDDLTLKMWQMLGVFNEDLTELEIFQTPLSDYCSYRGSAFVRDDGMFVLYSTTFREWVKGSKSIDGRDVIVASCRFTDLLNHMKETV